MTINYSLTTLLRVKEHTKTMAEGKLREAQDQHINEKKKLIDLKSSLETSIHVRTEKQNNFFLRAKSQACNKREIICHISSREKQLCDESSLKQDLAKQEEIVRHTYLSLEMAKAYALDAHKNLKLIEKHYSSWQQQKKRFEDIKEEYESDDRNGVSFVMKKA